MKATTKRRVAATVFTVGLVVVGAGPAAAGEVTGTGDLKGVEGKSECAYSGLNDGYFDGSEPGVRTQSYGQIVRYTGSLGGLPGYFCNPTGKRMPTG